MTDDEFRKGIMHQKLEALEEYVKKSFDASADENFRKGEISQKIESLSKEVSDIKTKIWWIIAALGGSIISNFPSIIKAFSK